MCCLCYDGVLSSCKPKILLDIAINILDNGICTYELDGNAHVYTSI